MKKLFLLATTFITIFNSPRAQTTPGRYLYNNLVPRPVSIIPLKGTFLLSSKVTIYVDQRDTATKKIGEMLASQVRAQTGFFLKVSDSKPIVSNGIYITAQNVPDSIQGEGYLLVVTPSRVTINARTAKGRFYGMQTLLQMIPVGTSSLTTAAISIPSVSIFDNPRFSWRGVMLDVGRYFYSVNFLKKFIDYMAMHKLNTFHWHLTEDHGWRIEIKKYPRLTDIAAWREATQFNRTQINNTPSGGYYTQDQIRQIVAYAADRYITVVPEIEMPGHSLAALVAYPELSCTGGPFQMPVKWNIQKDVYCAGNEKTFEFLENVLTEVVSLFPSPIIHIGGDECPKDRWKQCTKCQARIRALGLKDEFELQSYFIQRIEKFLLTKSKNIIGWDEILEGGLAPNAAVMSWRGIKGGIEAAKQHHNVVMTPTDYFYFDYYQSEPYLEPIASGNGPVTSIKKVYSYEPVSPELTQTEARYIIGVQGNVWSEYIQSPEKVEYMLYPRAAALAEIGWTQPDLKNWTDFSRGMEAQYARYQQAGINYAKSAYNVDITIVSDSLHNTGKVTLSTNSFMPLIRYTTDGNEPTEVSTLYEGAFTVTKPTGIKAAVFKDGKIAGKISEVAVIFINK